MKYTVVFPSKDAELAEFCIENLLNNSKNLEEIILLWNGEGKFTNIDDRVTVFTIDMLDVYGMFNYGVTQSKTSWVLLVNDDMFFPPDWDNELKLDEFQIRDVICFKLVEPGYVDVNERNVLMNFGMDIYSFDVIGFNAFALSYRMNKKDGIIDNLGWFMPVLITKPTFNVVGGYPTFPPFPYPNDILFFKSLSNYGCRFKTIESPVYHFQRHSQRPEMFNKLNLCCGNDKKVGYLNVDKEEVDLSKGVIPYQDGVFKEVLWKHAIEHFRLEIAIKILYEIKRILKYGGSLELYGPELTSACEDFLSGVNKFPNCAPAINRLYGLNDSEEQVHKYGYTVKFPASNNIKTILETIGFAVEEMPAIHADEWKIKGYKTE